MKIVPWRILTVSSLLIVHFLIFSCSCYLSSIPLSQFCLRPLWFPSSQADCLATLNIYFLVNTQFLEYNFIISNYYIDFLVFSFQSSNWWLEIDVPSVFCHLAKEPFFASDEPWRNQSSFARWVFDICPAIMLFDTMNCNRISYFSCKLILLFTSLSLGLCTFIWSEKPQGSKIVTNHSQKELINFHHHYTLTIKLWMILLQG